MSKSVLVVGVVALLCSLAFSQKATDPNTAMLDQWVDCMNVIDSRTTVQQRFTDCINNFTTEDLLFCEVPECINGRQAVIDNANTNWTIGRVQNQRIASLSTDFPHGENGAGRHIIATLSTANGCVVETPMFLRITTRQMSNVLADRKISEIDFFADRNSRLQQFASCGFKIPQMDDINLVQNMQRVADSIIRAYTILPTPRQTPQQTLQQQLQQIMSDDIQLCDPFPRNCVNGTQNVLQMYNNLLNNVQLQTLKPSDSRRISTSMDTVMIELDAFTGTTSNGCLFATQPIRLMARMDPQDNSRVNFLRWVYADEGILLSDIQNCGGTPPRSKK